MAKNTAFPTQDDVLRLFEIPDELTTVLRGHQIIESLADAAISAALPVPHVLEIQRLPFGLKIDLLVALELLLPASRPLLVKLNNIRNQFAHKRNATLDERQARDLYNLISPFQHEHFMKGLKLASFNPRISLVIFCYVMLYTQLTIARRQTKERKAWDITLLDILRDKLPKPRSKAAGDEVQEYFKKTKARLGMKDDDY